MQIECGITLDDISPDDYRDSQGCERRILTELAELAHRAINALAEARMLRLVRFCQTGRFPDEA